MRLNRANGKTNKKKWMTKIQLESHYDFINFSDLTCINYGRRNFVSKLSILLFSSSHYKWFPKDILGLYMIMFWYWSPNRLGWENSVDRLPSTRSSMKLSVIITTAKKLEVRVRRHQTLLGMSLHTQVSPFIIAVPFSAKDHFKISKSSQNKTTIKIDAALHFYQVFSPFYVHSSISKLWHKQPFFN